jgi:carboxyl-terminal processing protease
MPLRFLLAALLATFSTLAAGAEAPDKEAAKAFDARLFSSPALATPYRDNISDDEKVAGLSKFWSEVKYNFVYVERLKALDWDKLYLEYLPKVRATASTAEYYDVLMQLCALLQDGHTNVYPSDEVFTAQKSRTMIATHLVEGRVLVRDVYDPALRAQGVLPGVEVTAVDGEPAFAFGKRVYAPYQSASTPQDLDLRTFNYAFLSGPLAKAPTVTFRSADGNSFDVVVKRYDNATRSKAANVRAPFELRMLPGGVAYVALNSFGSEAAANGFIGAFDQIAKATALVIDVRNNGGGNSNIGYRVLATLTGKPFATGKWSTRRYLPSYRAWGRPMPDTDDAPGSWQPDPAHQFAGPVRVLTSSATFSAAEDFAVAFDSMRRGVLVGGATGGSTGQPLFIKLPGGGQARICTKADTYADGKVWVGVGVQPGLKVHPTVADLRSGRDTVLEAALASLKQ